MRVNQQLYNKMIEEIRRNTNRVGCVDNPDIFLKNLDWISYDNARVLLRKLKARGIIQLSESLDSVNGLAYNFNRR